MKRIVALAISLLVRGGDLLISVMPWRSRPASARAVVLYYHAVTPNQRVRFARQMDELLRRAAPTALSALADGGTKGISAAVTFDDGFRSVVENAVPELEKRGIPFTCFVPSGCLGMRPSWVRDVRHPSWHERVVSEDELEALTRRPLATVGSHSITHPNMLALDEAEAERELTESKIYLESLAKNRIDWFSFPHGAHNQALLSRARRAGYRRAFTIEPELVRNGGGFAVGRVAADPADWLLEFRLKLAGAYRWRRVLGSRRAAA